MSKPRRATGATAWDGRPHVQPSMWRRLWCRMTGGHRIKFSTYPRGLCIKCAYWPERRR